MGRRAFIRFVDDTIHQLVTQYQSMLINAHPSLNSSLNRLTTIFALTARDRCPVQTGRCE